MMKRSDPPCPLGGVRSMLAMALVVGGALAPRVAQATKAIAVTLEEDSGDSGPTPADQKSARERKAEEEAEQEKAAEDRKSKRVAAYSLPWQLRPVLPNSMVRSDNSFAFYGVDGASIINSISVSYKFIPRVSAMARLVAAEDSPPNGAGGFGLANPLLGAQAGFWPAKSLKLGVFLGFTIPIGVGGGATSGPADRGSIDVIRAAQLARSGFDNPLFMPDYFTGWPGVDIAYITHGLTIQGELSMEFLAKVKGPQTERSSDVDLTLGLHAGYFFFPFLSFGIDVRHQHWLTTPSYVLLDPSRELKDISTIALGPRFLVHLSEDLTWKPGLSMSFGLDRPVASSHYKTVQIDLPFSF
jgi:hypothetical protein